MSFDIDVNLLMILLQEKKYPYFELDELDTLYKTYEENVYLTAYNCCLMKADGDKKVKVGPIEIEGPGADYWINLAQSYLEKYNSSKNNGGGTTTSRYRNMMMRVDEL